MLKPVLAAVAVLAASCPALAVEVPLDNGDFDPPTQPVAGGFTQAINNWVVSFSGSQPAGFSGPPPQGFWYSGVFTSFGKFNVAPTGPQFVVLTNQGTGTVTMQSSATGGPAFLVNDRELRFRYAFMTQDDVTAASHDEFRVSINFFTDATATTPLNGGANDILNLLVADRGTFTDTNVGSSATPFGDPSNTAAFTYNDAIGTTFNLVRIDIEQMLGSFARVSFIVNNAGPVAGTGSNGLGVSGIVLDNVILTPEPSTMALFAAGIAGLGGLAWRRRAARKRPA